MLKSIYQKGNESQRHYILKQLARIIAFQFGYKIGAEEVYYWSCDLNTKKRKNIADYIALKYQHKWIPKKNEIKGHYEDDIKSICIEAKQSREDFNNGFVTGLDVNYIIAPKGLLTKEDMPKGVGLIEIDFDNLKIDWKHMDILKGMEVVKKASKCENTHMFKDLEFSQKVDLMRQIGHRNTIETMFIRHGLEEE